MENFASITLFLPLMVRFEPESQEKIAGPKGGQEKKREGLVKQTNPVLAADTERQWVRPD